MTYIGDKGSTVIDYVFVNDKVWEDNMIFKVEERVDSDQAPLTLQIEQESQNSENSEGIKRQRKSRKEKPEGKRECILWNEETIEIFKQKTKELCEEITEKREDKVAERWKDTKEIIRKSWTKREIKIKERKLGYKRWWNRNCSRLKRITKIAFRKWKMGKSNKEEYIVARKKWREECKDRKQK